MTQTDSPLQLAPVYRGEQIRAAEQPLIDQGLGAQLMRRAAYGLAACAVEVLQDCRGVYGSTVTALVGSGNNGGDALYALSFLRRRGVAAYAVLVKERVHQAGLAQFRAAGGHVTQAVPCGTDVLIDAVVGTGFSGEYQRPEVSGLQAGLDSAVVIACDLPSGVDADTGRAGEQVLAAAHTVTFGGLKQGLLTGAGGHLSGQLHLTDIGVNPHLPPTPVRAAVRSHPETGLTGSPLDRLQPPASTDHKYSRGVVHIHAGSPQFPGAAYLTVAAALATGAGMVTLAAAEQVRHQVVAAWPEVVGVEPHRGAEQQKAAATVIGPGLGDSPGEQAEAEDALQHALNTELPCVLDASGLRLIRDQLNRRGGLKPSVLITPHVGEARNLAADLRDQVLSRMLSSDGPKADPVEAARRLSGSLDCAVLLKGATTVIAVPEGEVILHRAQTHGSPGVPGLATAGTGDVLSGLLGALAATQQSSTWLSVAARGAAQHAEAAAAIDPYAEGRFSASGLIRALWHQ